MTKKHTKADLIWILPYCVGDIFIFLYIPVRLLWEIPGVGVLSPTSLVYIAVSLLIITRWKIKSADLLAEVVEVVE